MILSLALQVEHVLLFEFRVFSFGKICFILSLTQKNIAVVKRGDKPHIYQIAPVGLEKQFTGSRPRQYCIGREEEKARSVV